MKHWDIQREPRGEPYAALIRFAAGHCNQFTFYLTGMELEPEGLRLLDDLREFLLDARETIESPANLFLDAVTMYSYRLDLRSAARILRATDRLYAWQEPELPNDLCLMVDERPFLTILADERLSYLSLTDDEYQEVVQALPRLRLRPD